MSKKRFASRADFLDSPANLPVEEVPAPQLGKGVVVRMKALDALRGHQASTAVSKLGSEYVRPIYVAFCAVDDEDKPIFDLQDVEALARQDWELIRMLSDVAFRLNKARQKDEAELIENFGQTQAGDSHSG